MAKYLTELPPQGLPPPEADSGETSPPTPPAARLNGVLRKTDERRLRIVLDGHRQWRRRHRRSVLCVRVKGRKPTKELVVFIVSA